jgi:nonribosomal peptide synthetase CepA
VLEALPSPQIGFNYLGRFAAAGQGGVRAWQPVGGVSGSVDPGMSLPHALDVNVLVEDGPGGPELVLRVDWRADLLDEAEAGRFGLVLLDMLSGLARHVEDPSTGGHTASDFDLLDLDQDEIESFEALAAKLSGGQTS